MNAAQQKNVTTWGIVILIVILVGLAATKRFGPQIAGHFNGNKSGQVGPGPNNGSGGNTNPNNGSGGNTNPNNGGGGNTNPNNGGGGNTNPNNGGGGNTNPNNGGGGNTNPNTGGSTPVPRETLDNVIKRIDAAPDSKYPFFKKAALKGMLNNARKIDLIATITFASGESSLSAQSRSLVDQLMAARLPSDFTSRKDLQLLAVGYASPPGSPGTNLKLAEQRADSVQDYLQNDKQLPMTRVHEISVGETQLLNASESSKNQAVEIWLVEIDPANVDDV